MRMHLLVCGLLLLTGCGKNTFAPEREVGAGAPASTAAGSVPRVIHVDANALAGGAGTSAAPYNNIADAVATAQTLGGAIVIVEPGTYTLTSTVQIQGPIDLRGSNVPVLDATGWPTGTVVAGTETKIVGTAALGARPLLSVKRLDGGLLQNVQIRDLSFETVTGGGDGLELVRVQGYTLRENIVTGRGGTGFTSVASSGKIVGNYLSMTSGAGIRAGYAGSPANVEFVGNRSVHNFLVGLVLNGSSSGIPEIGDQLYAVVQDNDLSDNASLRSSFGIRIFDVFRAPGSPGDTQSSGHVQARVQGNRIVGNGIGVGIDAGFPYRSVNATCDPRVFSGSVELELKGNTMSGSILAPGLFTFTRVTAALNQAELPLWQYLHSATINVLDPDGTLAQAWIDHPERDPYVGACPNDGTQELLGNTLIYNGSVAPNMRSVP